MIGCDAEYEIPETAKVLDKDDNRVDKRIVLDEDNDPNHFDPRYFGKDKLWHTPNPKLMISHYEKSYDVCLQNGARVFNAGKGGKLEVFPRVDFEKALSICRRGGPGDTMSEHHYDVSIIIPSFQQGPYIRQCLESVLIQKDINVEIFLFDSCSTDETHGALARYSNLASICIEKIWGKRTRSTKYNVAGGEMIGFLNSDDILLPGSIERALLAFRRNGKLDLFYGEAFYIDEVGERTGKARRRNGTGKHFKESATFASLLHFGQGGR